MRTLLHAYNGLRIEKEVTVVRRYFLYTDCLGMTSFFDILLLLDTREKQIGL